MEKPNNSPSNRAAIVDETEPEIPEDSTFLLIR